MLVPHGEGGFWLTHAIPQVWKLAANGGAPSPEDLFPLDDDDYSPIHDADGNAPAEETGTDAGKEDADKEKAS